MLHKNRSVSVLIRTRDRESFFQELLQRLSYQTLQPCEVVVVDNFSSDKKLEEMQKLLSWTKRKFFNNNINMKLVPLSDKEFSHSYSTNVGVFVSEADLVCITNGHSLPVSNKWLEAGASHFENQEVAGVGGYFSPHCDGTFWEKLVYNFWKNLYEISKAYIKDNYFSTIDCILRKPLWKEYPFDENLPSTISTAGKFGGEDYDWALEMQTRGYKIIVDPKFSVYHSHREKLGQITRKYFIWRQIRKKIKSFKRPRKSFTILKEIEPTCYII